VSGLTALSLQRDAAMTPQVRVAWLNEAMGRELRPAADEDSGAAIPVTGIAGAIAPAQPADF